MKNIVDTILIGALMALPMIAVFAIWAKDGMPY